MVFFGYMRRWSIALFRVGSIRIEMHATFGLLLALAAYSGWTLGGPRIAAWSVLQVLLAFGCVVLHELGHAFVAIRLGIRVPRIVLLPIGGMAELASIPRRPAHELAIAAAGPAVSFALASILAAIWGWPDVGFWLGAIADQPSEIPAVLIMANLGLGVFNLLPAFPMDGGRMLRALLATRFDYVEATRWAARTGQVIAVLCCAGCLAKGLVLPAALFLFIVYVAETEYQFTRRSDLLAGLTVGDVARRDFLALPPEAPVVAAWALLRQAVPQDLLLLDHGRVVGIVTRDRLAAAVRHRRDDDSVALHADPHFVELQAEWPLADVSAGSLRSSQTLFPVYASGQLTGVLDALHLEETVRLIRRRPRRD